MTEPQGKEKEEITSGRWFPENELEQRGARPLLDHAFYDEVAGWGAPFLLSHTRVLFDISFLLFLLLKRMHLPIFFQLAPLLAAPSNNRSVSLSLSESF